MCSFTRKARPARTRDDACWKRVCFSRTRRFNIKTRTEDGRCYRRWTNRNRPRPRSTLQRKTATRSWYQTVRWTKRRLKRPLRTFHPSRRNEIHLGVTPKPQRVLQLQFIRFGQKLVRSKLSISLGWCSSVTKGYQFLCRTGNHAPSTDTSPLGFPTGLHRDQ